MGNTTKIELLTKKGKKEIEIELRQLIDVKRPEVIKLIQEAREQGDLSENADYDSAKIYQAQIEGRIKELQNILNNSKIIDDDQKKETKVSKNNSIISIGSIVKIHDHSDNKTYVYEIVGSFEADPGKNLISNSSPLAKALFGHKLNDVVKIREIDEPYNVTIKEISNKK